MCGGPLEPHERRFCVHEGGTAFDRKRLDVVADPTAPTGYRLVPTPATGVIDASAPNLPYGGAKRALFEAMCHFDMVDNSTKAGHNAVKRLAAAVVAGAGTEEALAPHLHAAIAAAQRILMTLYRAAPEVFDQTIETTEFSPTRVNSRPSEPNRFAKFSNKVSYTGWKRSLHGVEWFDSTPERTLANLLDDDDTVSMWARIQRGELVVEWQNGRYSPDLYANVTGTHYLFEVKSDKDVGTHLVQAKKKAAEDWARFVTDTGDHGTWRYVLIAESVFKTAKTVASVLNQATD